MSTTCLLQVPGSDPIECWFAWRPRLGEYIWYNGLRHKVVAVWRGTAGDSSRVETTASSDDQSPACHHESLDSLDG